MNKSVFSFIWLLLLISAFHLKAQESDIQAYMNHNTFYSPEKGNYIEVNLAVKGSSLKYKKSKSGKYKSKLQVTMIFSQNDTVQAFEKYNLYSPEIKDTSTIDFNFVDLKRFKLDTGAYDFTLKLKDAYQDTAALTYDMPVFMQFNKNNIEMSSVQLVESYKKTKQQNPFSKNGLDIIPYMSHFFPDNVNTLTFYNEIYNTDKILGDSSGYLVNYYLESYESNEIMDQFSGYKRMYALPMNIFINKFDIEELPTGNYNIVIELKDRDNKRIAMKKKFFQRLNPDVNYNMSNLEAVNIEKSFTRDMDRDSLLKYIPTLDPIANNFEKLFIRSELKRKDLASLQKYFLNFWRGEDPMNPEKAWKQYYKNVQQVEKFFATTILHGYETDRGRVYLQYGPPNTINERDHEPSSYPYEIWHYHQLTESQWNKKFVFYNPDLVTNDYELIHSNAIGEAYNPTWKYQLNKRNSITNDPYNTDNPDHWGSEAEELYNNPY